MALYKGFSTINKRRKFRLSDFELVKQDIVNHFHIRKGEKLMNPDFGTIIWGLMFEPFTPDVRAAIIQDVKSVSSYDPRVNIDSVHVTEYEQGIKLEITLTYLQTNDISQLILGFNKLTNTLHVL